MPDSANADQATDLLLRLPGVQADELCRLALQELHQAMGQGHTCLHLADLAMQLHCQPETLRASLSDSGLVGERASGLPVLLEGDVLASRRYRDYEAVLAGNLQAGFADLAAADGLIADGQVADDIAHQFPQRAEALVDGIDWQRLACCTALAHRFALITGGPGTGKTTVAGNIVAILSRFLQRSAGRAASIFIAAPTGKAAQRLRESLLDTGRRLIADGFLTEAELPALTSQVATLHRLVYDRELIDADLLVVDEVSMADVATLSRVVDRIPDTGRLLLLGDPQQLASVEAGHVLGALARDCEAVVDPRVAEWYVRSGGTPEQDLAESAVAIDAAAPARHRAQVGLRKNWRSAASPAVSRLADCIRREPDKIAAILADPGLGSAAGQTIALAGRSVQLFVERRDLPSGKELLDQLMPEWLPWATAVVQSDDPLAALGLHARRRPLCARRQGPYGVSWLNAAIEDALEAQGTILRQPDGHYPGRPLLVTRNNYDQQIFNGDIGIVVDGQAGRAVAFPQAEGVRHVPLHVLEAAEPVFAMSIHKSQGSQFEHVDIITAEADSVHTTQLLNRELIYTAVTRAAYSARIWADTGLLEQALARTTRRTTGLGRFLH